MKIFVRTVIAPCLALLTIVHAGVTTAAPLSKEEQELRKLVSHGGYLVRKGETSVAAFNQDQPFIPASTWKVATALAGLKTLGPHYRFSTEFYHTTSGDLYIRGLGDPLLVSEEISLILDQLQSLGVKEINRIFLDDSAFALSAPADGAGGSLNPYDVSNGALAANFNTINFTITKNRSILSAEPQTPTLPLMRELASTLPVGTHRINISNNQANVLRHVGELFRALQRQKGIPGQGGIAPGRPPAGLEPLHVHQSSKELQEVIAALMLYSNNYITNQLFLTLGASRFGAPADWGKAKEFLQDFLEKDCHLSPDEARVEEGSGLSRKNRITPKALLSLLEQFKPYAHLLPLDHGRRIKSGTLDQVYSYVGYFQDQGRHDSFVLLLNQPGNHRDRAVRLLERIYRQAP